jgi:DUF2911 family protein
MSFARWAVIATTFAVFSGCRAASAPVSAPAMRPDSGAFVVRLGNDTVSAESFRKTGDRIEGVVVRRVPRTSVLRYVLTLAPSGLPKRLEYNSRMASGEMFPGGARAVIVTFTPDSAITEIHRDSVVTVRVMAPNAYPDIDGAVSLYALPIAALRTADRDSGRFVVYAAGASRGEAASVARKDAGRYWVYSEGYPTEVIIDADGRVLSVDGSRTTLRIQSRRQSALDVSAIAATFAERERIAGAMTALSPRDSIATTVGGARISVGYGRPAARGRRIFGPNGVLGDTLWRTGANQETKFYTDSDLAFAGSTLPAGTYSLMTLAVPGRYQLIFDSGTQEVRVPLQASTLSAPLERFTIAIEPTAERMGTIRLRWDTMELSSSFNVLARP